MSSICHPDETAPIDDTKTRLDLLHLRVFILVLKRYCRSHRLCKALLVVTRLPVSSCTTNKQEQTRNEHAIDRIYPYPFVMRTHQPERPVAFLIFFCFCFVLSNNKGSKRGHLAVLCLTIAVGLKHRCLNMVFDISLSIVGSPVWRHRRLEASFR